MVWHSTSECAQSQECAQVILCPFCTAGLWSMVALLTTVQELEEQLEALMTRFEIQITLDEKLSAMFIDVLVHKGEGSPSFDLYMDASY